MKDTTKKRWVFFFILITLLVLITGKVLFTATPNTFLMFYGTLITSAIFFTFLISLAYKDPSIELREKGLNKGMRKPFVSCVMAVRNEEKIVAECVDSLLNSDYAHKEIIIVNDASTDKTQKVLDQYKGQPGIFIITLTENVGKKKAIGEGLKLAKGEIFVFTDSDSVVAPDAISRIIEVMVYDENVGAVSGHGRALNSSDNIWTKIQDSWYETQFSVKKAFESVFNSVTCVSGPLAVFRRSAIYNYIPAWVNDSFLGHEFRFSTDRQLTGYVLGSKYVGKELKQKYKDSEFIKNENYPPREWKVIYCRSAKVLTTVPDTFKKFVRQNIRWKKSFIRNLFFTGRFYWRKPIVTALRFYFGAMFVLVGPFIALRHLIYLPLSGDPLSGVYYLGGILFIGALYGLVYRIDNKNSHLWIYRPLMSIISTLIFSWLIFYSLLTIKKNIWHR